jgi:hypothetical protein
MGAPLPKTRAAALRLPAKPVILKIDGIEVTQAIQNMAHSVPLIAGKATVARVYLTLKFNFPLPPGQPSASVTGEVSVRRTPAGPVTKLVAANAIPVPQQGSLKDRRKSLDLSLNFLIPDHLGTAGDLYLRVSRLEIKIAGFPKSLVIPVPSHTTRHVTLVTSPPLRVRIVGIRYTTGTPPQSYAPSARDFQMVLSWLRRAYPVPEVLATQAIIDATSTWPFFCGDVNAQLSAIRALDVAGGMDRRTHYYGLVADGADFMRGCASGIPQTPDPTTVASGPVGSATFGWDNDGCYGDWYTGHELGHTFGRFHPGFCGETHDDSSYPFANGQLSNSDGDFVGFDFGDAALGLPMQALPGVDWHDVMTYCTFQWLSSYTYMGVRNRIVAEETLGAAPGPVRGAARVRRRAATASTDLIQAVARVNTQDGSGRFVFVNPIPAGDPTPQDPKSPVLLRALDASGKVLAQYRIAPKHDTCQEGGPGGSATIDAIFPKTGSLAVLELTVSGKTVDTFRPTTARLSARSVRSGTPPKDLRYTVQTSIDGGATWQTQAVGAKSRKYKLNPEEFGAAKTVKVRIIASNGFESSVVSTENRKVQN